MILSPGALVAERSHRRPHDWPLILSALALTFVGIMALRSVDMAMPPGKSGMFGSFMAKQCILGVGGLLMMVAFSYLGTEVWRRLAGGLYVFNILILGAVLLVGKNINGAKRWIAIGGQTLQPGDFAKVFAVITLAAFLAANIENIREWRTFWRSLLHIVPPMALLVLEPHYGAAFCIFLAWVLISLYAGVPWQRVVAVLVALLALLGAAVAAPSVLGGVLKGYHMERLQGFVTKLTKGEQDTKNKGYQTVQSEIAVSLGGTTGQGFGRGERKIAHFVPEQESDFIFTVIGEELGFAGSVAVLGLFGFFLYRVWLVSYRCREPMDQMIAAGILALLGFHFVANLSMVLNVGVVIGLWLPFMSAGGTALMSCLAMVGLLDSLR
ncbi:MAG: FtsW/RodA/SpoVE family cell cycle protein [Armatimonadetes bacterium]|nr:FtsW/RodA/SpoVE family cell cycle protein [Armatimonadota bacterium]